MYMEGETTLALKEMKVLDDLLESSGTLTARPGFGRASAGSNKDRSILQAEEEGGF
jgi:hypothetical protein